MFSIYVDKSAILYKNDHYMAKDGIKICLKALKRKRAHSSHSYI